MDNKKCKDCGNFKAINEFMSDPRMASGFSNTCKVCKVEYNRRLREERKLGVRPFIAKEAKTCTLCEKEKPVSEFYNEVASADGKSSKCKKCKTGAVMEWRKNNREAYNESAREWGQANPDKRHAHEIKRRYGCTLEKYNEMLSAQGGACAICKKLHNPQAKKGKLHVDHCHKGGQIRALLCGACNSMLGYANDDTRVMAEAIAYLIRHKGDT